MKHTALRSGNAVLNHNRHHLKVKHVWFHPSFTEPNRVTLDLPGSKTNQFHKFEPRRLLCCCNNVATTWLCPVHVLKLICSGRLHHPSEALFMDGTQPFTYTALNDLLKRLVPKIDLDPKFYTSKCLRIGGATDAMVVYKWSAEKVMKEFNWKTRKVMLSYVRDKNPDLLKLDNYYP